MTMPDPRKLLGLTVAACTALACGSPGASTHAGSGGTTGTGGTSGTTSSAMSSTTTGTSGENPDAGISNPGLPRSITVTNTCTMTVWTDALPKTTFPNGLPVKLDPGQSFVAGVDNGWSGRVWGRFGCAPDAMGTLKCDDDPFASTLAELTLTKNPGTGLDFYDVSLVDGFDLPMALIAVGFTADPAHPYSCGAPTCATDLRPTCPTPLQDKDASNQTIACANDECKVIGMNNPTDPACIYPNQYTMFFKMGCPQAYSYPSDDPTSTFTCKGKDYHVIFCP